MSSSLIDVIQSQLGSNVIDQLSSLSGGGASTTNKAMRSVVPALLAGALQTASTPTGASRLVETVRDVARQGDLLQGFASWFEGGRLDGLLALGRQILEAIFGSRTDAVAGLIANQTGIPNRGASSLLQAAAPLVIAALGRQAQQRSGLSAASLLDVLRGERGQIASLAPPGLASLLGVGNLSELGGTATRAAGAAAAPAASWLRRVLPALLVLGALLLVWNLLRGRDRDLPPVSATGAVNSITLPGGSRIDVRANSLNDRLARFLAGVTGSLPQRFVFDDLEFETGSSRLTTRSLATVEALAAILRAYPNAEIVLEGHTDATGDAGANEQLALDRANAVKAGLVTRGVAENRIATLGRGASAPLASNDSEAERAQNRRTELVVQRR